MTSRQTKESNQIEDVNALVNPLQAMVFVDQLPLHRILYHCEWVLPWSPIVDSSCHSACKKQHGDSTEKNYNI